MTIQQRIEQAKTERYQEQITLNGETFDIDEQWYHFEESELHALLRQVQDEQINKIYDIWLNLDPNHHPNEVGEEILNAPYAYEEEG